MVDGAGIGSAMTANKVKGVLAAACYNETLARNAREHNDANVLTLGSGHVDLETGQADHRRLPDDRVHGRPPPRPREDDPRDRERTPRRERTNRQRHLLRRDRTHRGARSRAPARIKGSGAAPAPVAIPADQVAKLIDHTLLKPEATAADIEKLCDEAQKYGFYSVCVNPVWVPQAKALLRGTSVKVCAVVGFPLGAQAPDIKALEARRALREGAQEIDMVINIGALKSKDDAVRGPRHPRRRGGLRGSRAASKVILETALLTDEEKVRGLRAGHEGRSRLREDLHRLLDRAAPRSKTSRSWPAPWRREARRQGVGRRAHLRRLVKMVQAGATRIGSSTASRSWKRPGKAASGKR